LINLTTLQADFYECSVNVHLQLQNSNWNASPAVLYFLFLGVITHF